MSTPEPSPQHLAELRALLVADRERSAQRLAALTGDFSAIVEAADLTATDDEHDPEGSTIAFERSQTGALIAATTTHQAEVEAALTKLDEGTYGGCELCGQPIDIDRLLARPAARACIACARQAAGERGR